MSMIGFPLLLIPLAIYNIFVFLLRTSAEEFAKPFAFFKVQLASGQVWTATLGDALVALGLLLLILEMIKAARPGAKYFTDHLLSFLVFAGAAAEFAMVPQFATSTFFLLTVLTLVDFLASIGIRSRREQPAKIRPIGKQRRGQQEPAFEPSAASDLASPTNVEPKSAPVVEPHVVEPQPVPNVEPYPTPVPSPVPVDHPDAEPKRDPAVINPQR